MNATTRRILAALWIFQVVNYFDRVVMSFAGPSIMKSLGIGTKPFGVVLSSFALGYLLAQIPGGMIADRKGTKAVLVIGPLFWALFTGFTGLAATVTSFLIVRLLFGLSEGISNSSAWKVLGDNFSPRHRPRAIAIWAMAVPFAPTVAGPLISLLMHHVSWRAVFGLMALPALAAAGINFVWLPSKRQTDAVLRPYAASADTAGMPLSVAFQDPALWVMSISYFCYNIAYWGFIGWMPTYLAMSRGIDLRSVGFVGGIPYIFGCASLLLVGQLGSSVLHRKLPQMMILCYLFGGVCLFGAFRAHTLFGSMAWLSGAASGLYGSLGLLGALIIRLAPSNGRASYSGIMSAVGQLGGVVAPLLIGASVSRSGSFGWGFGLMAASLIVAAMCLLSLIKTFERRTEVPTLLDGVAA